MSYSRPVRTALAASILAWLSTAAFGVPVAEMGRSGDSWEQDPAGYDPPVNGCASLSNNQFVVLPTADSPVRRLEKASVARLDEQSVAKLLGLNRAEVRRLSTAGVFFSLKVKQMEDRKRAALSAGKGSWSGVDEVELDRLKAVVGGPELRTYHPYLIRAFQWPSEPTTHVACLSQGYVRTIAASAQMAPAEKPKRAAAVIFLPTPPRGSIAWWVKQSFHF